MNHRKAWMLPALFVILALIGSGLACGRRDRASQEVAQAATPTSVQVATQPPADQPPADQPPADQPPAEPPPAGDQPPADQPPAEPPPAGDQPPADQPPADQPPQPGLPVIDYFYAEASENAGCYFLHWDLHDATAAFLNDEGVTAPSSTEVCPEVITTYTLRAENAAGSVDQTVTIEPGAPPEPP